MLSWRDPRKHALRSATPVPSGTLNVDSSKQDSGEQPYEQVGSCSPADKQPKRRRCVLHIEPSSMHAYVSCCCWQPTGGKGGCKCDSTLWHVGCRKGQAGDGREG